MTQESYYSILNSDGSLKSADELKDIFVTETMVIDSRLGDHIVTLDELRNRQKLESLSRFGFDPVIDQNKPYNQKMVASHLERYDVHMAKYIYYAHVILTFIVFENRLISFGKTMKLINGGQEFDPEKRCPDKANDNIIGRFEAYLKICNIPCPDSESINDLRIVRNCLVHANGNVLGLKRVQDLERLKELAPRIRGLKIDSNNVLCIDAEACLILQESMRRYFFDLMDASGFYISIPIDRNSL